MYPHERSLVAELRDEPFALIGVNSDDLARARRAVEQNALNWRSFQNRPAGAPRAIADEWGVRSWPTIVVLDAGRTIHYRGNSGAAATSVVRELLAQMKK